MEYQEFKGILNEFNGIYLYGAGVVAYGAYKAVQNLLKKKIKGFLVTDKDDQAEQIEEIPVQVFKEVQITSDDLIVIATPEEYHDSIEQVLQKQRVLNYIKLDSHTEYVLMGQYLKKACSLKLIEDYQPYHFLDKEKFENAFSSIGIYMAVSHMDRKLGTTYREEPWIKKIQVGAALTEQRIADITDEGCDGLSEQNALYGELTAAYYAWKYGTYSVTGIFHYRRILKVTEEQLQLLKNKEIDVILPLPFVCYPDASGQYGRYLLKSDVRILLRVLREKCPESFEAIKKLLETPYLYNYNMLIARKEVFDDYCSWIFPLLQETMYRCEMEKRDRMPRYIGRIGEILTSLYFMRNERKWKIVHAEKVWRV